MDTGSKHVNQEAQLVHHRKDIWTCVDLFSLNVSLNFHNSTNQYQTYLFNVLISGLIRNRTKIVADGHSLRTTIEEVSLVTEFLI